MGGWRALITLIALPFWLTGQFALAGQGTEIVERFTAGFVKGDASEIKATIHPDFSAEGMDSDAFSEWIDRWLEWCDDYEFKAAALSETSSETGVAVSGEFQRNWLLGIAASDTNIVGGEEKEILGALEEEGGAVQSIDRIENITFTITDGLIIGIEGMTLSDPRGSAMGMRDPRIRKLGEFFSSLDDIPVIGGLFSSSETAFSGAVKSIATIAVVIAALFGAWVLLGTMVANLRLSGAMARHSFPEGASYEQQHAAYTKHREQLQSGEKESRRHDFYLRQLLDEERFQDARDYTRGMIAFCTKAGDAEGRDTYAGYLKRVDELEHAHEYADRHPEKPDTLK